MPKLESKIEELRNLLSGIQSITDSITSDSMDTALHEIHVAKQKIDLTVQSLKASYPVEVLQPYNQEMADAAKQISKSFDNVITNHKHEISVIQADLAKLSGQRKISNYQR